MTQATSPSSPPGLHRYAVATAIATFCLLIAGGLVTSTDSGLSVPDWPLSYGGLFPPMVGGIAYEHSHRLIAGVVALLILGLALRLRREPRRWVRRLGQAAAIGVLLQAILGGLTVLFLLPPPVSVAHACLGPTVFCLVAGVALATSKAWHEATGDDSALHRRSLALLIVVFAQLALGAVLRHTGRGLQEHVGWAVVVIAAIAWVQWGVWRTPQRGVVLGRLALALAVLGLLQIALGVLTITIRQHPLITTAHVAVGALIYASSWLLVLWTSQATPPVARVVVREAVHVA